MAVDCLAREFPNKISHVLNSEADAVSPRRLTPAFFGCYDWHSAVHNHWLLARLARLFPEAAFARDAIQALERSLTAENIGGEVAYLRGDGRQSFERPYGFAWLLQLAKELHEWNGSQAIKLARNLAPLEQSVKLGLSEWLEKLPYPVRTGEHNQTAFSMGLMIDYSRSRNDEAFLGLVTRRARDFYLADREWPIHFEPSGEDFLSPGLGEADLMRRILPPAEYAGWLAMFLPQTAANLRPVVSPDPGDPKFSHLDGLNLSRAWMLEGILSALPGDDPRIPVLLACAEAHSRAGTEAVTKAQHYVGSHWLGTFAVYLLKNRAIST